MRQQQAASAPRVADTLGKAGLPHLRGGAERIRQEHRRAELAVAQLGDRWRARLRGCWSAMTWSTNGHFRHSAAIFSGAATVSDSSITSAFKLRTAGRAITASPSQLGLRTTSGPRSVRAVSVTRCFLACLHPSRTEGILLHRVPGKLKASAKDLDPISVPRSRGVIQRWTSSCLRSTVSRDFRFGSRSTSSRCSSWTERNSSASSQIRMSFCSTPASAAAEPGSTVCTSMPERWRSWWNRATRSWMEIS